MQLFSINSFNQCEIFYIYYKPLYIIYSAHISNQLKIPEQNNTERFRVGRQMCGTVGALDKRSEISTLQREIIVEAK